MDVNDENPHERPLLSGFAELVDATTADGIPDFTDLQAGPYLRFWPNLIIYRHEPEEMDFRILFFGTTVTSSYGQDWTGQLVKQSGFGKSYDVIHKVNVGLVNGELKRVADSGSFVFQNREHKMWYEIKMPLRRNGQINEVLVIMDFS
jgi:hypothetical protein